MLNRTILEHFFTAQRGFLNHYFDSLDFSCEQEKEFFRMFILSPLLSNINEVEERELEYIDKIADKFASRNIDLNNPALNFYTHFDTKDKGA